MEDDWSRGISSSHLSPTQPIKARPEKKTTTTLIPKNQQEWTLHGRTGFP